MEIDQASEPYRSRPKENCQWYDEARMQFYDRDNKPFFVSPPPDTQYQVARNLIVIRVSDRGFESSPRNDQFERDPGELRFRKNSEVFNQRVISQNSFLTFNPFTKRKNLKEKISILLSRGRGLRVLLTLSSAFELILQYAFQPSLETFQGFVHQNEIFQSLKVKLSAFFRRKCVNKSSVQKMIPFTMWLSKVLYLSPTKSKNRKILLYPTGDRVDHCYASLVVLAFGPKWKSIFASRSHTVLKGNFKTRQKEKLKCALNFVRWSNRATSSAEDLVLVDFHGGDVCSVNFDWKPPIFDLKLLRYYGFLNEWNFVRKEAHSSRNVVESQWMQLFGKIHKGYVMQRNGMLPTPLSRQVVRNRTASLMEHQYREAAVESVARRWIFTSQNCDFKLLRSFRKVRLLPSRIHGFGIFVDEWVPEGAVIVEYVGESYIHEADYRDFNLSDSREVRYEWLHGHCYNFSVRYGTNEKYIDGTDTGNLTRFVNHCCEPNCESVMMDLAADVSVAIVALRDIYPGEELFYDYHFSDKSKERCLCNAPTCTGKM